MRWVIINNHRLPDKMKKMQESAIKQAKDFQAKSKIGGCDSIADINMKSNTDRQKDESFKFNQKKSKKNDLLDFITKDPERVLIILLILLLMDNKENFFLLLALIYILT